MTASIPHSIEAEQALLGAIMINPDALGMVTGTVSEEDFFEPVHRDIFRLMHGEITAGRRVTPVMLKDAMPDVEIAGLPLQQYLARIAGEATTIINAPDYAKHLKELAISRELILIGEDLRRAANELTSPTAALQAAWEKVDALRGAIADQMTQRSTIGAIMGRLLEADDALVIPTNLTDLDHTIAGGLRAGRLVIIGGRPAMGKTVIGSCIARRVATQGFGVSFFSLETDEKEMGARLAADALSRAQTPVVYRDIIAGQLTDGDRVRVQATAGRVGKLPMRLDCSGGLSIAEIEGRARTDRDRFAKAGTPLGLVVIDYLGLVRHGDRYRGRKVDEVGEISFGAKTMAKRLGCCVMLLAQLNRGVEQRDDKVPSMSDLRDSGNIEQDADLIGLLYRPVYYTEKTAEFRESNPEVIERYERERHKLELIVGKNKLGPTTTVHLWCDVSLSAIDNAARY
jgi:replicative DNA helicase